MLIDSDRIRRERAHRAWSQEQLAQVSGLGLRTVQRIESSGVASIESTSALASVFELSVEDLLLLTESGRPALSFKQAISAFVLLLSFAIAFFVTRVAFAEQFEVAVGVNIDKGAQVSQTTFVNSGERVELEFENKLKAVLIPGLVDVNGAEMISLSLQVFERNGEGEYTLLESPNLVHQDGGNWEIKVSGTPSGSSYRLVVTPRRS